MRRGRLALVAVVATLAGCGEIPQPFRHEGTPPVLARPKMGRGITIRPLDNFAQSEKLAAAMVAALEEREIPATVQGGPAFGHVVEGRMDEDRLVVWRLLGPNGAEAASHRQRLPATAGSSLLKSLASETMTVLAAPLAQDPDALASQEDMASRPSVRIMPLAGLPGDGDKTLAVALRSALTRSGLKVEAEGGEYLVVGSVVLSPLTSAEETAAINWTVRRARDGAQLASIDQGGRVPRGRLSLPWGALARDIAEGGAAGIAEVVQAAQRRPAAGLVTPPEVMAGAPTRFTEDRPTDIGLPDSSDQKDEARTAAAPAPGIAPPATDAPPAKTVKTETSSRIKRAQR